MRRQAGSVNTTRKLFLQVAWPEDHKMHITLMRHGKPVLPKSLWLAPFEMERWIARYNRSEVEPTGIPESSVNAAKSASAIMASTASRALSSVRALGQEGSGPPAYILGAEGAREWSRSTCWTRPHESPDSKRASPLGVGGANQARKQIPEHLRL
jgi:hypothetical protein